VPWATLHSEVGKERENAVLPSQTWSGYIFGGACLWSVIMPASSDFFFEASGFDDRSGCQDRSMVCRLTDELCLRACLAPGLFPKVPITSKGILLFYIIK